MRQIGAKSRIVLSSLSPTPAQHWDDDDDDNDDDDDDDDDGDNILYIKNTQIYKYKVLERPNMWYTFEKQGIQQQRVKQKLKK